MELPGKTGFAEDQVLARKLHVITYRATLPIATPVVAHLANLLAAERRRRGTRRGQRALSTRRQAVLVLRWFPDTTRLRQLATDHRVVVVDRLPLPPRRHQRRHRRATHALAVDDKTRNLLLSALRNISLCPWRITTNTTATTEQSLPTNAQRGSRP
jgi:hypothetical protein